MGPAEAGAVVGPGARAVEITDDAGNVDVDRQAELAHRVQDQHAVFAERKLVDEPGLAEDHRVAGLRQNLGRGLGGLARLAGLVGEQAVPGAIIVFFAFV